MKKLLTIFLGIALLAPLYSQEAGENEEAAAAVAFADADAAANAEAETEETPVPEKKEFEWARQHFTLGLVGDLGFGLDNGIIGTKDIFKKEIVIDLSKLAGSLSKNGANINFSGIANILFLDIKNIHIGQGLWNFGFTTNAEGNINLNISKSLFELIAEGNTSSHNNSGKISGSGGIYTEIGLPVSARYKVAGKTLKVGIKPSIYTPLFYIPSSTGISYNLYTEKNGKDGLFLDTEGEITVYTPTTFDSNINGVQFVFGRNGFDISLEGEYALFPFIDVGGSFNQIPFAPATLTTGMKMGIKPFSIELDGEEILGGSNPKETPEFNFKSPEFFTDGNKKIRRPFRFDAYVRYKPLKTELVVLRPNIGFSVNPNKGDEKGYFNAGLEARLNLKDIFIFYLGSGYQEAIWKQKAGFALNLRVFEFDFEAALRSQTFAGCFRGQGFNLVLGTRWGW